MEQISIKTVNRYTESTDGYKYEYAVTQDEKAAKISMEADITNSTTNVRVAAAQFTTKRVMFNIVAEDAVASRATMIKTVLVAAQTLFYGK